MTDGFFEWRTAFGSKFPYLIAREDSAPMIMAGIYDASGGCAILTAPSHGIVATLHDRMPVILQPDTFDVWLDTRVNLDSLRQRFPAVRPLERGGLPMGPRGT